MRRLVAFPQTPRHIPPTVATTPDPLVVLGPPSASVQVRTPAGQPRVGAAPLGRPGSRPPVLPPIAKVAVQRRPPHGPGPLVVDTETTQRPLAAAPLLGSARVVGVPVARTRAAVPVVPRAVPATKATVIATGPIAGPLQRPPGARVEAGEDGVATQCEGGQATKARAQQVAVQGLPPGATQRQPVELLPPPKVEVAGRGVRRAAANLVREV